MQTKELNYSDGETNFKGFVTHSKSLSSKAPIIILAHAMEGCNDVMRQYAEAIANQGYVVFSIDMFGHGEVATDLEGCMTYLKPMLNDRALLLKRITAAFEEAKKIETGDKTKIAGIGFCFGGMCLLDLARSGANINGVVSVHGALAPPNTSNKTITAKILALHGYDDPQVTPDATLAFANEMTDAGVDWQLHYFSHTKHAFSDPDAEKIGPPEMGRKYNPISTKRAWIHIYQFLDELFQ